MLDFLMIAIGSVLALVGIFALSFVAVLLLDVVRRAWWKLRGNTEKLRMFGWDK